MQSISQLKEFEQVTNSRAGDEQVLSQSHLRNLNVPLIATSTFITVSPMLFVNFFFFSPTVSTDIWNQFQCLNLVLNNKTGPSLVIIIIISIYHCNYQKSAAYSGAF